MFRPLTPERLEELLQAAWDYRAPKKECWYIVSPQAYKRLEELGLADEKESK